ncbi:hypothetical protein [Aliiglaciecola litoralis]
MKTLNQSDVQQVNGGLAYTGGDLQEWLELMRKYPYLLSVN